MRALSHIMNPTKVLAILSATNTVGVVHSKRALDEARALTAGAVDLLELRVDAFANREADLFRAAQKLAPPLIVTVRHPDEGGANSELTTVDRCRLFEQFLPLATFIDVELRSLRALAAIIAKAHALGVGVILSSHDFQKTPADRRLQELLRAGQLANADILKIAAQTESPGDLARLLALFELRRRPRLSVMGMGALGKVSRLLFARAGSVLNYGYLGEPQVSGQWSAKLLKKRIAELA